MGLLRIWAVCVAGLFILGCSSGKNADTPGVATPGVATPGDKAPPKTVFDPLTQQLDRARGVQGTVDQNTDGTRRAVDNQERGENPP